MKESQKRSTEQRYVTIEDAAIEAGVSERTVQRWKRAGKVHEIRDRLGHVRVSLEDVMDCRQEQSESPVRSQLKQLQAQLMSLSQELDTVRKEMEELQSQHNLGQQLLTALKQGPEESVVLSLLHQLLSSRETGHTRLKGGLRDRLIKRNLPPDETLRLKDFAEAHQYSIYEIKKLYQTGAIELSVYQRHGEYKRNKLEWWITQSEQEQLITYWKQHEIPFTPCLSCPHSEGLLLETEYSA